MEARRNKLCFVKDPKRGKQYQRNIIRIANASIEGDDVMCSLDNVEMLDKILATRTPPAGGKGKFKKRVGTRKVKEFERAQAMEDGSLTSESATPYRGMSARGNYLSQDRTDLSFSIKEPCRDFAIPNNTSFAKLKRVGQYCVGRPRLVYKFAFQEKPDAIDTYVDTDFA